MKFLGLRNFVLVFVFLTFAVGNALGQGTPPVCASLTTVNPFYTQDFDTLAASGTSSTVPPGFGFAETGTGANTTYAAGTGSSNTGNTYSFGVDADRAFGGLQSGTLIPTIGGCFVNNTGVTLSSLEITYDGEQWRLGATGRADRLDFQYSTNAVSLLDVGATWVDVDALDFTSPNTTVASGSTLNGNLAANRTAGITSVTPFSVAVGATFYIRFLDSDAAGADDALSIDNFSLTVAAATAAPASIGGRVLDADGNGLSKIKVKISGGELSEPLYALTSPFGYFNLEVPAGQTYVVTVNSKSYSFSNPTRVINVNDNVTDLNFTAEQR